MPDIDLEPHEYRPKGDKHEPLLTSSGIARLGFLFIALVFVLLANKYLRPYSDGVIDWLLSSGSP